jgi:hypothetical protein
MLVRTWYHYADTSNQWLYPGRTWYDFKHTQYTPKHSVTQQDVHSEEVFIMQSRRSQHNDHLREPAPSTRMRAAREAVRRVTLELLQSNTQRSYSAQEADYPKEDVSNGGHTAQSDPAQDSTHGSIEQKTRLLDAIQPVLEVVAESALRHSDPPNVQL